MSRGKRYDEEPKLNMKKVFAVILAIAVIIMFIFVIKTLLSRTSDSGKNVTTNYFAVYANQKWGVIDSNGKTIIEPSYQEMIVIPDSKKDIFLCTYDVTEDGTYQTKALNAKNQEILKDYEKVEALYNHTENQTVFYEEDVLKVQKDGKYGLINLSKKEILPCEYEEITNLKETKNSILVKKDGKLGLVDTKGNFIINPEYKTIEAISKDYQAGYIVENEEGKYGVIDFDKTMVIEPKYAEIATVSGNHVYVVKEDKKWKLVNKNGETVLDSGFDEITEIQESYVIIKKKDQYGLLTTSGKEKIKATYEDLTYAFGDRYIFKKDGTYGVITADGEVKLENTYDRLSYEKEANLFMGYQDELEADLLDDNCEVKVTGIIEDLNISKGYVKVRKDNQTQYYNFKFEEKTAKDIWANNTLFVMEKDGQYGYEDKNGKVIVEPNYDEALEQNVFGYAAVKKDGRWGSIDAKGNIVLEPKYTLENNVIIDFIGTWHYGTDLNMNYYTDQ